MANPSLDINDFEETNETIGSGSFADVRLVRYKGREYAGKYFRQMKGVCFDKCLSECGRSFSLEHPNIVKTIGLVMRENKRAGVAAITSLVLVMEKLTVCLSRFVIQEKLLPEYVKLSILYDVTKGLRFLHLKQIMHRDLTANNILLTETLCAKISDLGQSKNLNDIDVIEVELGQTVGPGTPIYMPPEAKRISSQFGEHKRAEYDFSIDVYSFGILVIHVYLQDFPIPKSLNGFEDKDGRGITFRQLSPVENLKKPIDKSLPHDHKLRSLVCECLDVKPRKRPSPETLLVTVGATLNSLDSYFEKVLRYATSYVHAASSVEVVGDDVTLEQKYSVVTEKNKRLKMELENLKKENESLTSQLSIIRDDGWQFVKKGTDEENGLIYQTVQAFDEPQNPSILTYKQNEKKDFIDNPKKLRICSVSQPSFPIESSDLEGAKAVLINNKIFIGRRTKRIHSYDCRTKKWEALPEAPVKNYALANYQGQLVIVGGTNGSTLSGDVYCYYNKKWLDCGIIRFTNEDGTVENITFPSLVIPRKNAVAIGFDKNLIVLGGEDNKSGLFSVFSSAELNSVEVYYGGSNRWYKGSDLPQKGSSMQYVCADRSLYLLLPGESNVVYCSLDQLVTTSTTGSTCEVWHTVKNHKVNFNYSSLAVYNKTLLTLAGDGSDGHVYAYKPNENKRPWKNVDCKPSLPAIKNACCLQISQHELFLCGGDFGIMPNQAFQVGYLLTVEDRLNVKSQMERKGDH